MKSVRTHSLVKIKTHVLALLLSLLTGNAIAEIRTITATGEYRMGDNDTRSDAKRLALLDAKRLALEQAGTYVESFTEVKNLDLAKEEIRAYTAGILEVTEQATRTTMEGETIVILVDVTTKIDTDAVGRQIDALRKNEELKTELVRLKAKGDLLQKEVEIKSRELATLRSTSGVEAVAQQRRELIVQATTSDLLGKAVTALGDFRTTRMRHLLEKQPAHDKPTLHLLRTARAYAEQAFELDPLDAHAKEVMGELLSLEASVLDNKGEPEAAAGKLRSAIDLQPNRAFYHSELASLLLRMGDVETALTESRTALRLDPKDDGHIFLVGMVLVYSGDVDEAVKVFRSMKLPSGLNEHYFRHYFAGITLKTLLEEGAAAQTMVKDRDKLPKKKVKVAATIEFSEYLRLAPDTDENQELIAEAKANILELKK